MMKRTHTDQARPPRRTRQLVATTAIMVAAICAIGSSSALGAFGLSAFDAGNVSEGGAHYSQAGGHPAESFTALELNSHVNDFGISIPDEPAKDVVANLPAGLLGNTTAVEECTLAELTHPLAVGAITVPHCPLNSIIGISHLNFGGVTFTVPLFNMKAQGVPARWGINIVGTIVLYEAVLRSGGDYGVDIHVNNISQTLPFVGTKLVIWGVPSDPVHDNLRCRRLGLVVFDECTGPPGDPDAGPNTAAAAEIPYVTMPTRCTAPEEGLEFKLDVTSWYSGSHAKESVFTHDLPGYPEPPKSWGPQHGASGCNVVPFDPDIAVAPSTQSAETPNGLRVRLKMPSNGILNPDGISQAHMKKAVVTLPEGVTVNPSSAEGLGVCSPVNFAEESLTSSFSEGCPDSSKIGTVSIVSPLVDQPIEGTVYLAQQDDPTTTTPGAENPFDSLLALYVVARNTQRGIFIELPAKVEADARTGRLVTTFDDLPQLPFETFDLKFREGARSPLVTPAACGTYTTEAEFVPWSAADPEHPSSGEVVRDETSFQITSGPGGGPCPSGGIPPFKPGFTAGALNNNAGSYSPFSLRLTRNDGEQDMTKFSSVLPPGVSAKIAGVTKCSEASIAAASARGRTGRQELASPSCPASSEIGHTLVGVGVGSVLTYVPGKVYFAGPYNGAPLSVVSITPAVAGPFDVGAVVVREALTLDPKTAEVHVDGDKSEPIPHILKGIPLKLRDLRVYVDRPDFTINPTSCDPSQVGATLFGSYADVFNPADDMPVALSSRFQAANCAGLPFKPRLGIKLRGGTERGGHPALTAVLRPRPGDANLSEAQVTLPRSAFLDQSHIRTVCTRVQFAAAGGNGAGCAPGSVYGHVKAWTPLLDEPLSGPAYLRSSKHKLPDLVFALHGVVDIETAGRIDSVKGGIRASFEGIPDAPISKAVIEMQGGKKGLIVNSRNLCAGKNRAKANLTGQNGKTHEFAPLVRPRCEPKHRAKRSP